MINCDAIRFAELEGGGQLISRDGPLRPSIPLAGISFTRLHASRSSCDIS